MPKRVLIVAEGHWGEVRDYRDMIESYRRILAAAEVTKFSGNGTEKEAIVEVVETAKEAEREINCGGIYAIIFISRGMEMFAEKFAATYPKIKVVVFTGLIPYGKVIWIDKMWATEPQVVQRIVLH